MKKFIVKKIAFTVFAVCTIRTMGYGAYHAKEMQIEANILLNEPL